MIQMKVKLLVALHQNEIICLKVQANRIQQECI